MPHGLPDFWQGTIAGMPTIGAGQIAWYMSDAKLVNAGETWDLINYVAPDTFELHICSGVVSCGAPRLQRYDLRQTPTATWISPTSHSDPDEGWLNEEQAYDNDFQTLAVCRQEAESWSSFLILLINPTYIDKVRFDGGYAVYYKNVMDIDVYYTGAWHHIFEGIVPIGGWNEKELTGTYLVEKARIRFYNPRPEGIWHWIIKEFQFNTKAVTPQEGIWFDTQSIIPYLPQAPYIVEPRATFAVRVYNDDELPQNMSVALAGFLQKKTM